MRRGYSVRPPALCTNWVVKNWFSLTPRLTAIDSIAPFESERDAVRLQLGMQHEVIVKAREGSAEQRGRLRAAQEQVENAEYMVELASDMKEAQIEVAKLTKDVAKALKKDRRAEMKEARKVFRASERDGVADTAPEELAYEKKARAEKKQARTTVAIARRSGRENIRIAKDEVDFSEAVVARMQEQVEEAHEVIAAEERERGVLRAHHDWLSAKIEYEKAKLAYTSGETVNVEVFEDALVSAADEYDERKRDYEQAEDEAYLY